MTGLRIGLPIRLFHSIWLPRDLHFLSHLKPCRPRVGLHLKGYLGAMTTAPTVIQNFRGRKRLLHCARPDSDPCGNPKINLCNGHKQ